MAEEWTAEQVKEKLRLRYAARTPGFKTGPWVTIEEFEGIDLWAISGWTCPAPASQKKIVPGKFGPDKVKWPRIGHEIKVTRSDMRSELLKPHKRVLAVALCSQFYFVTPAGLLTDEEKKFEEPEEWQDPENRSVFIRPRCEGPCEKDLRFRRRRRKSPRVGKVWVWLEGQEPEDDRQERYRRGDLTYGEWIDCPDCGGKGYTSKSVVELEAPTLWIPRDVGLLEVSYRGTSVIREAPLRDYEDLTRAGINQLARWVSIRPDPRHH